MSDDKSKLEDKLQNAFLRYAESVVQSQKEELESKKKIKPSVELVNFQKINPTVREFWKTAEEYLKLFTPEEYSKLNPPASEEEIDNLENILGFSLIEEFKDFLRVHNGTEPTRNFLTGGRLLGTDQIAEYHDTMMWLLDTHESDDKYFSKNSILFLAPDNNGYCLDMRENKVKYFFNNQGSLNWDCEDLLEERELSFTEFLQEITERLKKNEFNVSEFGFISFSKN